jgi:ribosomal protein S18 acetylase RimI-like enzyme
VTIRPARPEDAADAARITRDAYRRYIERIGREPAPMTADHEALIAAGEVWLAEIDGAAAGVLVARPRGQALLLESVAVAPEAQGRGVGRALIEHAEQLARKRGLPAVELYTNVHMTENQSIYPHLGYEEVGRGPEGGYERVFYRKALTGAG